MTDKCRGQEGQRQTAELVRLNPRNVTYCDIRVKEINVLIILGTSKYIMVNMHQSLVH